MNISLVNFNERILPDQPEEYLKLWENLTKTLSFLRKADFRDRGLVAIEKRNKFVFVNLVKWPRSHIARTRIGMYSFARSLIIKSMYVNSNLRNETAINPELPQKFISS